MKLHYIWQKKVESMHYKGVECFFPMSLFIDLIDVLCNIHEYFNYIWHLPAIWRAENGHCLGEALNHLQVTADLPSYMYVQRESSHQLDLNPQQLNCWEALVSLHCTSALTNWATDKTRGPWMSNRSTSDNLTFIMWKDSQGKALILKRWYSLNTRSDHSRWSVFQHWLQNSCCF